MEPGKDSGKPEDICLQASIQEAAAEAQPSGNSEKLFDIAEFQGPNLSEEESDGEIGGQGDEPMTNSLVTLEPEALESVLDISEKSQSSLDLNGHEEAYFGYNSPDMSNYEHLLEGKQQITL